MNPWNFKAAKTVGLNKAELTELSPEQQERIPIYEEALRVAEGSQVPNPIFSGYLVRGSIGLTATQMLSAGNIEYGLCQALHCEETGVAVHRVFFGKNFPGNPVLGFCSQEESEDPPTCCGSCRDILLDTFGPELEFVAGKPNGGTAVVSTLSQLLYERYERAASNWEAMRWSRWLKLKADETVRKGRELVCDPYSPENIRPERRYSVCLETVNGRYFGARDVMCDYHPIYAGRDAVRQAIRNRDPFIKRVVIVCEISPGATNVAAPHVMYKDRQHLLETNLQAELLSGREQDPEVYLFAYGKPNQPGDDQLIILSAWRTSLKTWLPFPFTARNFGPEFVEFLTKYYKER